MVFFFLYILRTCLIFLMVDLPLVVGIPLLHMTDFRKKMKQLRSLQEPDLNWNMKGAFDPRSEIVVSSF